MGCLKCGKETGASSLFCDECLNRMSEYPVKTDVAIQLPPRSEVVYEKKPVHKKKQIAPAELLRRSRKRVLWLSVIALFLALVLAITLSYLVHTVKVLDDLQSHGKNYTTVIN